MKKAKRFLGLIIIAATVLSASGCRTINTNDIANALSEISDVMAENLTESSEPEEQTSSEAPESETSVNDGSSEAESSEASESPDEQSVVSEAESSETPKTIYNTYQPELGDPELYIGSLATFLDEYPEAYCGNCPQDVIDKFYDNGRLDKNEHNISEEDFDKLPEGCIYVSGLVYFYVFYSFPDGVPEDFEPKYWKESDFAPYIVGHNNVDGISSVMYRGKVREDGYLQTVWFGVDNFDEFDIVDEVNTQKTAWELCRYDGVVAAVMPTAKLPDSCFEKSSTAE